MQEPQQPGVPSESEPEPAGEHADADDSEFRRATATEQDELDQLDSSYQEVDTRDAADPEHVDAEPDRDDFDDAET